MLFGILFLFYVVVQGLFTQGHGQTTPPSPTAQIAEKADINTGH